MKPVKSHRRPARPSKAQRAIADKIAVRRIERDRRRSNGEPVRTRAAA